MRRLILRCGVALGAQIPAVGAAQEGCKPATEATKLPAVSALLDSASLIANLPAPDLAASSGRCCPPWYVLRRRSQHRVRIRAAILRANHRYADSPPTVAAIVAMASGMTSLDERLTSTST
jgi:hypothetical protein